jgi:phage terminase large subunit-like protein
MNYEQLLTCNVRQELARRNFRDFVLEMRPNYSMRWFHSYICDKLTAFAQRKIKKLMVFMPPQHGKSEITTRLLPAYIAGKDPNRKLVVASYNATLATRFNRDIQRVIDTELYADIFKDTRLNNSNVVTISSNSLRNSEIFEFVGYSGYVKTVGRGGALTGTTVDVGIIDDPIKDRAEAVSKTIRDGLWAWYEDVFETRLHNDSQQILIQTRWHKEDLAGRLLARDKDWEVIVFEGIKENNYDYDPRAMGEALWPEKHSLDRLLKVREMSPITFNSLYQQSPELTHDMGIFWDYGIIERQRVEAKPDFERVVVAVDPAVSKTQSSDETGVVVAGIHNGNGYVIDDLSGRYSPDEWATVVDKAVQTYGADVVVAEKNQGGDLVETNIRRVNKQIRVKLIHASKGKDVRAEPVFALYERGKVWHVGNLPVLEFQMATFNPELRNTKSPDRVDALVFAITELLLNNRIENWVV